MGIRRDIDARVRRARRDARKADDLVRDYLPFIKAETAKFMHRPPQEGRDDELSIAMFAFHEAVMTHDGSRGAFIPHATRVIRNRLVDFTRREARHAHTVSLDQTDGNDDERTMLQRVAPNRSARSQPAGRPSPARGSIPRFSSGSSRRKSCRSPPW